MATPLVVDYYSDILCIWAWIAQRRIEELNTKLQDRIEIRHHFVDVFGDVAAKMDAQWQSRGGYAGFAEHVRESASAFEYASVNEKVWREVKPLTSANAHLMLKAVEIAYGRQAQIDMALAIRIAFFVEALDVGNLNVLLDLAAMKALDANRIRDAIGNGSAIAALMKDYQESKQNSIKGSPSYVLDGGRQTLYGNVGYRVLLANIEELLKSPQNEASWC